jgi:hypothetical protein
MLTTLKYKNWVLMLLNFFFLPQTLRTNKLECWSPISLIFAVWPRAYPKSGMVPQCRKVCQEQKSGVVLVE